MIMKRSWPAALLLLSAFQVRASAQSLADYDYANLSFRGAGLDYGFIWPSKVEATSLFSLRLDLGYLGPGVRISPSVSYWSSTFKQGELARLAEQLNRLPALQERDVMIEPGELGTIELSDLSFSVDAHLVWTTPVRVITYLGAGVALHVLNGSGTAVGGTFVEDLLDSTPAGVAAMAGAELQPFRRFRLYAETRYNLLSDVRYPGLRVGGAFMLPQRVAPTPTPTQETQRGR
jgi:opacity protein-like surface antigen